MIGQNKLKSKLFNYNINTLPNPILLVGEYGCGKHTLVKELVDHLNLSLVEIDSKIGNEQLNEYAYCPIDKIYTINLNDFDERSQNQFLKFIEEPNEHVHIILYAESEIGVLKTIINRCSIYYFDRYSKTELMEIARVDNDIIYEICTTPGQILQANEKQINELINFSSLMVNKFSTANYANALSISTKINYAELYDKYDIRLFFNVLAYSAYNKYLAEKSNYSYQFYIITNKYKNLLSTNANKEFLVLNYLNELYNIIK